MSKETVGEYYFVLAKDPNAGRRGVWDALCFPYHSVGWESELQDWDFVSARGRSGQWHLKSMYWGLKVLAVLHVGMDCSSCKCRLENLISQLCSMAMDTSRLKAGFCMAKIQICADCLSPAGSLAPRATCTPSRVGESTGRTKVREFVGWGKDNLIGQAKAAQARNRK